MDATITINSAEFVLFLRECFQKFFRGNYPYELIQYIIMLSRDDIKIYCSDNQTYLIKNKKHIYWSYEDIINIDLNAFKFISHYEYDCTCAGLTANGDMYIWGENYEGQLGLGDYENINYPQKILSNIKMISCGPDSIFAVNNQGKVYAAGYNYFGQLGLGDNNSRNTFQKLNLSGCHMVKFSDAFTIFLLKCGGIYTCGFNCYGQLGLGHNNNCNFPHKLNLNNIISIDAGTGHVIVLSKHNKHNQIFVWGKNFDGQLGLGDNIDRSVPCELILDDIISISCGHCFTLALTKYGDIYGWGNNKYAQLGCSKKCKIVSSPLKLSFNSKIISINSGSSYTFAVDVHGEIYYWEYTTDDKIVYEPKRFEFM